MKYFANGMQNLSSAFGLDFVLEILFSLIFLNILF